MAEHCGTAVVPARPWKPRDKAKVEVAVQIAERWIAARLRNQRFFSLSELNTAIRVLARSSVAARAGTIPGQSCSAGRPCERREQPEPLGLRQTCNGQDGTSRGEAGAQCPPHVASPS